MRNVSDKCCRENKSTHFVFNKIISENGAVRMYKNAVQPDRPLMTSVGAWALHDG